MHTYYMDLETYSEVPIGHGSHAYADPSSSRALLWAYAKDDEPVKVWDCDAEPEMPDDLRAALEEIIEGKARHVWQNGFMFDTVFLDYRLIPLPLEKCDDTMVMAYQCSLPGSLEDLCKIFGLPEDKAKIKDGKRLINVFCSPKYDKEGNKIRLTGKDRPEDWERFKEYCARDVEAMRTIYKKFPKFNFTEKERELQLLDARINRRGICIDTELAEKVIEYAQKSKEITKAKASDLTDGELETVTSTKKVIEYCEKAFGIKLESLKKGELEKLVNDETLPEKFREVIALRLRGAKTSAAKYKRVLDAVNKDGRLRGILQFRGAMRTGRYCSRGVQFQNLPRPVLPSAEIEAGIEAIKLGCLELHYDEYNDILSDALRGLIIAPEGRKLCVADYSNVEGRVLAWLAGENWKLQAFRDFDAGHGHDLYKLTYGRTFGVKPEDVTKKQRQIGKVEELALGYGGGAGAFAQFALLYGINLEAIVKEVKAEADPMLWEESEAMWDWAVEKKITADLPQSVWIACNTVKSAWRKANPHIVEFWAKTESAVRKACENPGIRFHIRPDMYALKKGGWLVLRLPSGRFLAYPGVEVPESGDITYLGIDSLKHKWSRIKTFGAKFVENLVQAASCDLLLEAGLRLEEAGYEIVLSVHDEYICEICDDGKRNHRHMEALMSELPEWASGLPLTAAGFESYRYKKEG